MVTVLFQKQLLQVLKYLKSTQALWEKKKPQLEYGDVAKQLQRHVEDSLRLCKMIYFNTECFLNEKDRKTFTRTYNECLRMYFFLTSLLSCCKDTQKEKREYEVFLEQTRLLIDLLETSVCLWKEECHVENEEEETACDNITDTLFNVIRSFFPYVSFCMENAGSEWMPDTARGVFAEICILQRKTPDLFNAMRRTFP